MLESTVATIFGGSGFIGRYVVKDLAKQGFTVRIPTRSPRDAAFLRTTGVVGQVNPFPVRLRDEVALRHAIRGSSIVINLIGQLAQTRHNRFSFIQGELAGRIARIAAEEGVQRFIHISAIGADAQSRSAYAVSKAEGEALVRQHFPEATIIRPNILFGAEDRFFNRFAALAEYAPALPLIGGGKTKFQPVYVADIADAIVLAVNRDDTKGKTYELSGPDTYTFRELMKVMLTQIDRDRLLISVPFKLARLQARFLELLPSKPLTRDQVELLKSDVITAPGTLTFHDLGITPTALEIILPTYLYRFRKGGAFHEGPHKEKAYS